jgi:hypothetical protein
MPGEIPEIKITAEDLANIRANLGLTDGPVNATGDETFVMPKRRRGRPRKSPLPTEDTEPSEFRPPIVDTPAKLTRRDEREVAERLAKMLSGGTGIASMAKPYLQMTDEEAKDISDPLASYLVRNAETIPIAGQILENYDLAAIVFGVMAYVVRVYRDRRDEVISSTPESPGRLSQIPLMERVAASQGGDNGRQPGEGSDAFVSTPYDVGPGV